MIPVLPAPTCNISRLQFSYTVPVVADAFRKILSLARNSAGTVISDNPVNPAKLPFPIVSTLFGITTVVKPVHWKKQSGPISVTISGIVIDVILLQYAKHPDDIVIKVDGRVTPVRTEEEKQ